MFEKRDLVYNCRSLLAILSQFYWSRCYLLVLPCKQCRYYTSDFIIRLMISRSHEQTDFDNPQSIVFFILSFKIIHVIAISAWISLRFKLQGLLQIFIFCRSWAVHYSPSGGNTDLEGTSHLSIPRFVKQNYNKLTWFPSSPSSLVFPALTCLRTELSPVTTVLKMCWTYLTVKDVQVFWCTCQPPPHFIPKLAAPHTYVNNLPTNQAR